jgi:beta-N-acetylhexosaminidase
MTHTSADLVGQSLLLSFQGPELTPEIHAALERVRPAGVLLFANNIATPAGLHQLCADLQRSAAQLGLPPLLIAIDQEGGVVSRLPAPFITVPSAMAQAAAGDPEDARLCAEITGQQLRGCGVNLNFAPVLDVNCNAENPVIGTRSFGADAATVARFGRAALEGYRAAGVIATIKHFPGHGDTSVDSHLGLPVIEHGRARLDAVELAPFKDAIAAGAPALMSAHMIFRALDSLPATLSRSILTGLLRHELGFDGVIFTDALNMRAIADRYSSAGATVMAKAAGADIMLPLGTLESQVAVAARLGEAIQEGELSRQLFEATAQRLERLRAQYGIGHTPAPFVMPQEQFEADALAVARRGISVRDPHGLLPLPPETRLALIDCLLSRPALGEPRGPVGVQLADMVHQVFPQAAYLILEPEWSAEDEERALALARHSGAILLVTRNAGFLPRQMALAERLAELSVPLIVAAVRNPAMGRLEMLDAAIVRTYGDPAVSLWALLDACRYGHS